MILTWLTINLSFLSRRCKNGVHTDSLLRLEYCFSISTLVLSSCKIIQIWLTLCILMDSSTWYDTIHLGWFIVHKKGSQVSFPNNDVISSLKLLSILANSADPDEMPHYAAFHLGLHCLPKYLFSCLGVYKEFQRMSSVSVKQNKS